jgi:hypothetical protein
MAAMVGVHPSTISRDIVTLLLEHQLYCSPFPRPKFATASWVFRTFDTDGEVMFAAANPLTK